jgi:Skp family chaperone for outer membrane proteins
MKTAILSLIVALGPLVGTVQDTNGKRIATLSVQRLISESAAGRAANQQLQALAQKMSTDVSAKQKELQGAPSAGGDNRQAELQRFVQQSQAEYANAQRQLQNEFREKLNPIVASVAASHGVDLVLNGDTAVVWAAPSLDLTSAVLARLGAAPPK